MTMPKAFKRLMTARFVLGFAVQMQAVVIGWRVYDLKHDALALGLIGLSEAIPAVSVALFAGYIVDRTLPLKTYRFVISMSLLSALVLVSTTVFPMSVTAQVHAIYAAAVLTGTGRGFSQPSIYSLVPRIVSREELPRAAAVMGSIMQTATIMGPALGGLIFGWFGPHVSFVTIAALIVIPFVLLFTISEPPRENAKPLSSGSDQFLDSLLSGVRYVVRHPILLPAMALDMISVLFGGVTAILPIFAKEILFVGPKGLGIMRAAPAVGAAVTSFFFSKRALKRRAGVILLWCVAGFGISILAFGLSRTFWLSCLLLAFSGAFDSVSMIVRGASIQLASPDHLRGRISSVNSIFISSSNELGAFESGVAAKLLGTVPSVVVGSVLCLLTVLGAAWLAPSLRQLHLDELDAMEEK